MSPKKGLRVGLDNTPFGDFELSLRDLPSHYHMRFAVLLRL